MALESPVRMTSNNDPGCATNLLDDVPASADAFSSDGDVGPHQRVTDAVAAMIESSEIGGKAIGLEGGWGSGKSTVVGLLSHRFSKDSDYTVVVFDAWAHEGDPLRRTFLESIVGALASYGWVNESDWASKLEELANRRRKTNTRITPKATPVGTLSAFALLLVPLGIALTNAGLRLGVTLDLNQPLNLTFCLGLTIILGPMWVIVGRTLYVWCYLNRKPKLDDYAFIASDAISETYTETIETPEPTSLEFDRYFCKLMAEGLSQKRRRLLLVLDNLDRVEADTALKIWSTLQTFLHERDAGSESWYKQLWVLVPYDPIRIQRLWSPPSELGASDTPRTDDARRTTESFLDKSFPIRFHVAPPVLSDWKSYLYDLIEQALPSHRDDRHVIYRVFDHFRVKAGDTPTPRELKLYVNQVGAVHRQWQHTFPLGHIAFFVLARRQHADLIATLREGNFPSDEDNRLFHSEYAAKDLVSSLAGLAFNVPAAKGLELLLAGQISAALTSPTPEVLQRVAERNGAGFWAALESVANSVWYDEDYIGLTHIASQLHSSEFFLNHRGPERGTVTAALRDASLSIQDWLPVTDGLGSGVGALLELQADVGYTHAILRELLGQIAGAGSSSGESRSAVTVAKTTIEVLDVATKLGHHDAIPASITLPFDGEQWVEACSDIASIHSAEEHVRRIRPSAEFAEVSDALARAVVQGLFQRSHLAALSLSNTSTLSCNWEPLCTTIRDRLEAGQNAAVAECEHLLSALFHLETPLDDDPAWDAQRHLAARGHLSHHFLRAKKANEDRCKAAIVLAFTRQRPTLQAPASAGNSDAGHQALTDAVLSPENGFAGELVSLATHFQILPEVWRIIKDAGEYYPLFVEVLKLAVDQHQADAVFKPPVLIQNWSDLEDHLNDDEDATRFERLAGRLSGLRSEIQGADTGFESKDGKLYLGAIRGSQDSVDDFVSWCINGLRQLSEDEWKADMAQDSVCLMLAVEIYNRGTSPDLSNNFADALHDHAQFVVANEQVPPARILGKWATVLDCIGQAGIRRVLRERLIRTAVDADGSISDAFFEMYGDEMFDAAMLAANTGVLSHFFSALVREKHVAGIQWLDRFASENPTFLADVVAHRTVNEFTTRLQGIVDAPSESEVQSTIESVAVRFGIEASVPSEDTENPSTNQEPEPTGNEDED